MGCEAMVALEDVIWFLESLWLDLLEFGENFGRVKHETVADLKEK